MFLQDVRRLFTVLEHARENVQAVAAGLRGSLRIAVSDGAIDPRLSAFLARCRAEEPEVEIRLSEVPLAEQLRGLRSGDFMAGFAHTANVGYGIVAEPIWQDPLVIALPARHELLAHKKVPLHTLGGIRSSCAIPRRAKVAASNWLDFFGNWSMNRTSLSTRPH